ncbi:peptidase S8/S53 domain-containing protein [Phlebopus sp. FC_14]|nr:peptidase S8/S53 domain-containing protein [Phlebopus sp. FC_14]
MHSPFSLVLLLLFAQCISSSPPTKRSYSTHDYWVIEHNPSAGASLGDCTRELGLEVVEKVGELQNLWLVRSAKVPTRSTQDTAVAKYHKLRARATSDDSAHAFTTRLDDRQLARRIVSAINYFEKQVPRQRNKRGNVFRAPPPVPPEDVDPTSSSAIAARLGFDDPLFTKQWHIVNDEYPEHMMNVTSVWEMGITGEGVITSLVDDGLDYRSKDLAENFDPEHSYDFNDHTNLPTPVLSDDRHGTRCAGQIAAAKNDVCGVGLAYGSKVAGVRILSGPISDVDEAAALNYGFHNVSIYSCSWGPPDDGKSMEGPGYVIQKAVVHGIQNGRGGKGSIFVFASGNGAALGDQCNFDGYTNSIYSVTVAAVDYKGLHPYYSEPCAANMVVAYSSGSGKQIVTTDVGEDACTSGHGGTSAAAPNAAGVFSLALQARPDLTWRDIQHLCVLYAQIINPDDPDWEKTATGRLYSYKYGYGQLNAYAFVTAAQNWQLVKPQAWFHPSAIQINNGSLLEEEGEMLGGEPIIPGGINSTFTVTREMLEEHNLEAVEHLTIRVWISHTKRGDVEVELISPNGIRSVLAAPRAQDHAQSGFRGWRFMTVKHWGENPIGEWMITVSDQSSDKISGTFHGWRLMFWGSASDPSKAKTYVLPTSEHLLPSPEEEESVESPTPSSTKSHPKPTSGLPDDHDTAEGEADRPAFHGPSTTPSMTPTPDEGWFSDMSNLVSNSKWFFGALGAAMCFGIGAGIFLWRRRLRRRVAYSSLAVDEVAMSRVPGSTHSGPRAKELYDAFGELSDNEDADGEMGLHSTHQPLDQSVGVGFHSRFLDDDDPAPSMPTTIYRDELPAGADDEHHQLVAKKRSDSPESGSRSSWEHASQE